MRISLITVGTRMPQWVRTAFSEYSERLPREWGLRLVELSPIKQGKNSHRKRIQQQEGQRLLAAVPTGAYRVALDVNGRQWSTQELAEQLNARLRDGRDLALLVGGPEGLDSALLAVVEQSWSLSRLTFPHMLVRVIVAEQLYRAWSVLHNHPYHRA